MFKPQNCDKPPHPERIWWERDRVTLLLQISVAPEKEGQSTGAKQSIGGTRQSRRWRNIWRNTILIPQFAFVHPSTLYALRVPQPQGGVNFIRTFKKQVEDQAVNLPPNLDELVKSADYVQSPDHLVWQYFYNLKGTHPRTWYGRALCLYRQGREGDL